MNKPTVDEIINALIDVHEYLSSMVNGVDDVFESANGDQGARRTFFAKTVWQVSQLGAVIKVLTENEDETLKDILDELVKGKCISMPIYNCKLCDYEWVSRAQFIEKESKWIPIKGKACPFCKSHNWDKTKTSGGMDDKK